MSSDDPAISIRNLTKVYRIFGHPGDRLKQALSLGMRRYHRTFTAIRDISLDIEQGQTVGIIGRNGSGKSTLLQLVCGTLKPTSGTVRVRGRISALLELGSGFNPEFTGRENLYFQGALTGFSKQQIDDRFDELVSFADIGEFIDQPVRTYSSGMFVRLGFAAAVGFDPQVLIVDEALAVGDARFQQKCFRRFEQLRADGVTVLLVSHATEQIARMCDVAVLLDGGQLIAAGSPTTVIDQYQTLLFESLPASHCVSNSLANVESRSKQPSAADESFHLRPGYNPNEYRWGNRGVSITDFGLYSGGNSRVCQIDWTTRVLELCATVRFNRDIRQPVFGLTVKTRDGITIFAVNSIGQTDVSGPRCRGEILTVRFALSPHLLPGDYFLSVGVAEVTEGEVIPLDRRYDSIHLRIAGQTNQAGILDLEPRIAIVEHSTVPSPDPCSTSLIAI